MRNMHKMAVLTAAILTLGMAEGRAAEPTGTWSTEGGLSRVRISPCGSALCGTVISLKEPNDPETGKPKLDKNNADTGKRSRPLIGVPIVLGMQKSGDKWQGQVYNASDGKTYSGGLTLVGNDSLKLEGCVLGGMICKAQTWTRAN